MKGIIISSILLLIIAGSIGYFRGFTDGVESTPKAYKHLQDYMIFDFSNDEKCITRVQILKDDGEMNCIRANYIGDDDDPTRPESNH